MRMYKYQLTNITLSGWLSIVDSDKPIVIVIHGIAPNSKAKEESLLVHNILAKANINVLNIDLRNYGSSSKTGSFIKLGQTEYQDVIAAAHWLVTQKKFHPKQIGVAGLSLGAVTSAIAFSKDDNISALWLDSPFTNFNTMVAHELSRYGLVYHSFIKESINYVADLIFGFKPSNHSVIDAISNAKHRAIYITQGIADKRIPITHAEYFINKAKEKKVDIHHWLVKDEDHLFTMFNKTEEYQKNITDFFNNALSTKTELRQQNAD